ncbi:extracellular solute-binding protein [Paenibacillus luteus]|uniref:extracellular solute-binding protein n=1 Tax=Paenibacillus luteus TaxID=2545753 RepID=UPI0019D6A186|nr:extracellular solute-binding protein [Paenibacillus luteus]
MKRQTATLMAILLSAVLILSACSGKNTNNGGSAPQAGEETPGNTVAAGTVNEFGWKLPAKTTKIHFYQADQGNPDKINKKQAAFHTYLLDKFNVDITRSSLDVDPKEKLNLMLVSGDYPEVIAAMDDSAISQWKAQGKIMDLAPLVDQYGPNIKKELGARYESYLDEDGKLWGIPRGWGYLPIPDFTAHIRWDWYQELGAPAIETPEDYYNVLKQMVAKHPTNANGEKTYALSWNSDVNINNALGFWGLKDGYKEDADHNLTHWLNTEEGKQAVLYYNRFFLDGMMDPDAFVNKFDDWRIKFSSERIAGHIGPWWQSWNAGHEVWLKTDADYKEDKRYVQIAFKAQGAEKAYLSPKDTHGWNYTVLTDKAQSPEEIIKFLDFMMTPVGTRLLGWGIPNIEDSYWNYEEDGKWSFNETTKQALLDGKLDFEKTEAANGSNSFWLAYPQGLLSDDQKSTAWYDQNFIQDDKWKKLMHENVGDTIYDSTERRVSFMNDNPLTIKNQQIEELIKTGFAKAVMSKTEAEAIKNFDELREKAIKIGLADIEKYRTEQFKKNIALLK